jgi:hypothetical protein
MLLLQFARYNIAVAGPWPPKMETATFIDPTGAKGPDQVAAVVPAYGGGSIIAGNEIVRNASEPGNTGGVHVDAWAVRVDRSNNVVWRYLKHALADDTYLITQSAVSLADGTTWLCTKGIGSIYLERVDRSGKSINYQSVPADPGTYFGPPIACVPWGSGLGLVTLQFQKPHSGAAHSYRILRLSADGSVIFDRRIKDELASLWADTGPPVELADDQIVFAYRAVNALNIISMRGDGTLGASRAISFGEGVATIVTNTTPSNEVAFYVGPSLHSENVEPSVHLLRKNLSKLISITGSSTIDFKSDRAFKAPDGSYILVGSYWPNFLALRSSVPGVVHVDSLLNSSAALEIPSDNYHSGQSLTMASLSLDGKSLLISLSTSPGKAAKADAKRYGIYAYNIQVQ